MPTSDPHDPTFNEQVLILTDEGRNALAGHTDWITINRGIDRWLGGVHLKGQDATWRWDTQQATLIQVQDTA